VEAAREAERAKREKEGLAELREWEYRMKDLVFILIALLVLVLITCGFWCFILPPLLEGGIGGAWEALQSLVE
jgi:hypothetical protein